MRHARPLSTSLLLAILALLSLAAQRPPEPASQAPTAAPAPALRIRGVGLQETSFGPADLASLPRRTVSVKDKDEAEVKYEGVIVRELLSKAGMKFGQSLRGPRLRDYLLAEGSEGYAVIFALPELSDEFSDNIVLIADRVNGEPISGRDGPLRIVATHDKKHARWVRNVTSLTIQTGAAH